MTGPSWSQDVDYLENASAGLASLSWSLNGVVEENTVRAPMAGHLTACVSWEIGRLSGRVAVLADELWHALLRHRQA